MTDTCLCCGQPFTPFPTHPGVSSGHCLPCRRVLTPLWVDLVTTGRAEALRADEL